jgi:hypothetical protein
MTFSKDFSKMSMNMAITDMKMSKFLFSGDTLKNDSMKVDTYSNGKKYLYIGEMKDDRTIEGRGVLVFEDGEIFMGNWKNNKLNEFGRAYYTNGDSYEGYYLNNSRHGQGCYYYQNGNREEAYFKHGKLDGEVTLHTFEGKKRKEIWKDGVKLEQK